MRKRLMTNFFLFFIFLFILLMANTHFIPLFYFYFYFRITISLHSLGHLRRGGCNRYDTIQLLQPQSLFSIFIYLYLQTDFSPFTTTPVLIPLLLHNRKRSSVLVGLKVLGFLQLNIQEAYEGKGGQRTLHWYC